MEIECDCIDHEELNDARGIELKLETERAMYLPTQKLLIAAVAVALFSNWLLPVARAVQSGERANSAAKPYYSRPDFRAVSNNNAVTYQQRTDLVENSYNEMLANTNARRQVAEQSKDHVYPGSYQISPNNEKYVRRELPSRLVPPGRAASPSSAYSLKQPNQHSINTQNTPKPKTSRFGDIPTSLAPLDSPQTTLPPIVRPEDITGRNPRAGNSAIAQGSQTSQRVATQQQPPPTYRHATAPVQPRSYSPPVPQQANQYHVVPHHYSPANDPRTSQPRLQARPVARTTTIPAHYDVSESTVTRARILMQDGGDPYISDTLSGNQGGGRRSDPFADPISARQLQDEPARNPFSDPPEDLVPRQGDPFEEPPADLLNDPTRQDPFDPAPDRMPNVDPAPENPGDIQPNQQLEQPELPTSDPANSIAPSTDPRDINSVPRVPNETREPAEVAPDRPSPFKSYDGFEPTPILPSPPRRDYEFASPSTYGVPSGSNYDYGSPSQFQDQPTLGDSGFQKNELYEGVNVAYVEDASNFGSVCNSAQCQPGASRRGFRDRFSQVGSRLRGRFNGNDACQSCAGQGQIFEGNFGANNDIAYQFDQGSYCEPCGGSGFANIQANSCGLCGGGCGGNCAGFGGCGNGQCGLSNCGSGCGISNACEPLFYVSIFGGYTQLENDLITSQFPGVVDSSTLLEANDGYGVGLAIGQFQGYNLRSEIEFSFRENEGLQRTFFSPTDALSENEGSVRSFAGMFNLVWDFSYRPAFIGFQPYAGVGVGFGFFDVDFSPEFASGNDSSFAYQFMAGLSRPLKGNTDWFAEYRFFAADDIAVSGSSIDYDSDNIFFGFRKRF